MPPQRSINRRDLGPPLQPQNLLGSWPPEAPPQPAPPPTPQRETFHDIEGRHYYTPPPTPQGETFHDIEGGHYSTRPHVALYDIEKGHYSPTADTGTRALPSDQASLRSDSQEQLIIRSTAEEFMQKIQGNMGALVLFRDKQKVGVSLLMENGANRHTADVLAEIVDRELKKMAGKSTELLTGQDAELLRSLVEQNKPYLKEVKTGIVYPVTDRRVSGFFKDGQGLQLSVCCHVSLETDDLEYSIEATDPPQFSTSLEQSLAYEEDSRVYVIALGCCVGVSFVLVDAARSMSTVPKGTSVSQLIPLERVAAWGIAGLGTVWLANMFLYGDPWSSQRGGATITYKLTN